MKTICNKFYHQTNDIHNNERFKETTHENEEFSEEPNKFQQELDDRTRQLSRFQEILTEKSKAFSDLHEKYQDLMIKYEKTSQEKQLLLENLNYLQDENDSLLKMNYELTKEKTTIQSINEKLRSDVNRLSTLTPQTTLYSTNSSHFFKEDNNKPYNHNNKPEGFGYKKPVGYNKLDTYGTQTHAYDAYKDPYSNGYNEKKGFVDEIGKNYVYGELGIDAKIERISGFFQLFEIDANQDFIVTINELFNEFVRMRSFLRVF